MMKLNIGNGDLNTDFEFTIPETNKVGLFFSGGIESTGLLLLIINELKATGRLDSTELFLYTVAKDSGEADVVRRLLPMIPELTDVTYHIVDDLLPSEEAKKNFVFDRQLVIDAYNEHDSIVMYAGATNGPIKTSWADKCTDFDDCLPFESRSNEICTVPFEDLVKPQTIDILYKLGREDLIPYLYSCSRNYNDHCDECYSCEELIWGYKRLGKERPEYIKV